MKKIAVIGIRGYPYVYGGYETLIKEISERLSTDDLEFTIYCHKNLFSNYPKVINKINLIYIPTVKMKSLSTLLHSFFSTLHACFFAKYDFILYVNTANGPFGILTKLFRIKTAINTDGLEWKRPKWRGLGSKYFYYASYLSTKFFDVKISDSLEMQKIYKETFNSKSTFIPYGGIVRYSQNPELIDSFKLEKLDYYLVVGRLIPDNNVDFILEEYRRTNSRKKIVIVGDVLYKDKFANKMKKYGSDKIIFTGYVKDQDILAELYHNCYAYIHGHEYGGTNPTLLKALAYGAPILALNTIFSKEVLDESKYGILFDKKKGKLSNIILNIEKDIKITNSLREISRDKINTIYNWEMVSREYKKLIMKEINAK